MQTNLGRSLGLSAFLILWGALVYKFPVWWVYTLTVPPILVVNLAKDKRLRDHFISLFVVIWLMVFMLNTTRHLLLEPFLKRSFPGFSLALAVNKFLFPPAGPIMFFNVDDSFGFYRVSGIKNGKLFDLNPHEVILNRTLFYDNIHRGVLGAIGDPGSVVSFCRWMHGRFPEFDDFAVGVRQYPALKKSRYVYQEGWLYRCRDVLPPQGGRP